MSDSNLPTVSARDNAGKPQLSFLLDFPIAAEAFCRVKELGAIKYARDNWKAGGKPDEEYYDACMRHLFAGKTGELFAPDTGCLHAAHAAWNMFALIELNIRKTHDPVLFQQMAEYWRTRKGLGSQADLVDKVILGKVHEAIEKGDLGDA